MIDVDELTKKLHEGKAEAFEVWRWPAPDCPIVVLILETPEQAGRPSWHDVFVLDIVQDTMGWVPGQRGVRWTVSAGYGWEKVL